MSIGDALDPLWSDATTQVVASASAMLWSLIALGGAWLAVGRGGGLGLSGGDRLDHVNGEPGRPLRLVAPAAARCRGMSDDPGIFGQGRTEHDFTAHVDRGLRGCGWAGSRA